MTRTVNGKNKWDAALRLFGAFSGVEEDYLAACEADCPATGRADEGEAAGIRFSGIALFVRRYGRAMAAILCIAVLGASYLGYRTSQLSGGIGASKQEDSAAGAVYNESAADTAGVVGASEMCEMEDGPCEATEQLVGAVTEEAATEEGAAADAETDSKQDMKQAMEKEKSEERSGSTAADAENAYSMEMAEKLKMPEAEAIEVVGAYLPAMWPADGHIEDVQGSTEAGAEFIGLTWRYDGSWDSFYLGVKNLGDSLPDWVQESMVDVSEPESYDRSLYAEPYADTVPASCYGAFQNPIFKEEEITRECVAARILEIADASATDSASMDSASTDGGNANTGATNMPRGNFRVLYRTKTGNYVLVEFDGVGTVEEIWSLIHSINYFAKYEEWMKPPAP